MVRSKTVRTTTPAMSMPRSEDLDEIPDPKAIVAAQNERPTDPRRLPFRLRLV